LFELATLLLQTQMQPFLTKIATFGHQLVRGHLDYFFDFHVR